MRRNVKFKLIHISKLQLIDGIYLLSPLNQGNSSSPTLDIKPDAQLSTDGGSSTAEAAAVGGEVRGRFQHCDRLTVALCSGCHQLVVRLNQP